MLWNLTSRKVVEVERPEELGTLELIPFQQPIPAVDPAAQPTAPTPTQLPPVMPGTNTRVCRVSQRPANHRWECGVFMNIEYHAKYSDGYSYTVIYDPDDRKTYLACQGGGHSNFAR